MTFKCAVKCSMQENEKKENETENVLEYLSSLLVSTLSFNFFVDVVATLASDDW